MQQFWEEMDRLMQNVLKEQGYLYGGDLHEHVERAIWEMREYTANLVLEIETQCKIQFLNL